MGKDGDVWPLPQNVHYPRGQSNQSQEVCRGFGGAGQLLNDTEIKELLWKANLCTEYDDCIRICEDKTH